MASEPYTVQILYRKLLLDGREMQICQIRLAGRPGLVYSVDFFEHFAANICSSLKFWGFVYEGSNLAVEVPVPAGGIDVLDEPLYWLFGTGELRCGSARALQRAGASAGRTNRVVANELAGWVAS